MPLQNFIDGQLPTIKAAWLNIVDVLATSVFASAATAAQARTAIGLSATTAPTGASTIGASASTNNSGATVQAQLDNLGSATGAADVGFTAAGVGAVARTLLGKDRDIISVFDYLTLAQIADVQARTKTLNLASAIQSAVTASLSGSLWFPAGTYRIDSEVAVAGSINVIGAGREMTVIQLNSTTQNGFNVASDTAVHFRDLQVVGSALQTAGACIKVNGATNGVTTNPHSSFTNLGFLFCWHGIEVISAAQWRISGCEFFGYIDAGIIAQDTVSADSGDSFITENMLTAIAGFAVTADGVRHISGGGLHIVNNSFVGSGCAYHMLWGSSGASSQLVLQGNTIDSPMTTGGFVFDRTSSGTFSVISIVGNTFATNSATPAVWFKVNNASFSSQVTMGRNIYTLVAGGTGVQIDGGIFYTVGGEQFVANSVGTGIATGNSTATLIYLGNNQFVTILNPYAINTATQVTGGQFFGNASIDFGNVANGSIGTIGTVTVPGLAVGDICTVMAAQLIIGGVTLQATPSAANTAKVTALNNSGGGWNVGAGNVQVFGYRKLV